MIMKAIVYTQYGSPDILQFKEVEKPVPNAGEILVKVYAASANPLDWHLMRGAPFLARLDGGLRKPKDSRLGADFAGRVEAVGSNVTQFQPGDEVYGDYRGSFAEYSTVPVNRVALKPANLSFEEAAAIPVAAVTALQGLRDAGHIHSGQTVLINGASGGVGTFAVQIAKAFGAEVTGICSTRNLDMVREIGADHVIDYTQEDFTRNGRHYDLIFDAVGNRSASAYRRALNPNGKCVVAGFSSLPRLFEHMVLGPLRSRIGDRWVGLMGMAQMNQQDLVFVKELVEAGKVAPLIERCYPLREVPEAIRHLETGHARGKVVITVVQTRVPG
jgi:NADPH:quinone reductase-like Zn-dependent oxidoreductase